MKPFVMFELASLFLKVIFSAFIPTGMAHTLVQVSINDLLVLVLYVPIVQLLLGINNVYISWETLVFSIVLFVVVPLAGGALTRFLMIRKKGGQFFNEKFVPRFDGITTFGLLLTLIIIFTFQGDVLLQQPLYVLLSAASDFFELSVAVAIALFGPESPVVLACTVGVLAEVPNMLLLVRIVNKTKVWFPNTTKHA